ncbi:MAG: DMT family transporter [Candidatus Pelagibacter sp.]|tara:strand:+ start:1108 stop:1962 length:855 start_codon:yes stop_codon:yes gene_type:complete
MIRFFPLIFVILWSSAFITTKPITDNSDPFSALAFRFLLVAFGFFVYAVYKKEKIIVKKKFLFEALSTGILFHGIYLGGVFFSVSKGLPTGVVALIVTLQPILTNILASPILNEKISLKQWIGVILGFLGAFLVLGFDIGASLPIIGVLSAFIALISVTSATLWQKKLSNNLPLSVSNMYQAIGGCLFNILLIFTIGKPFINFSSTFLIAISHQIFLISFGAFTILMYMIKRNSASKTVTLFFLVPPTTALMAFLFLNEKLNYIDLFGFLIVSIGVFIATRGGK